MSLSAWYAKHRSPIASFVFISGVASAIAIPSLVEKPSINDQLSEKPVVRIEAGCSDPAMSIGMINDRDINPKTGQVLVDRSNMIPKKEFTPDMMEGKEKYGHLVYPTDSTKPLREVPIGTLGTYIKPSENDHPKGVIMLLDGNKVSIKGNQEFELMDKANKWKADHCKPFPKKEYVRVDR